MTKPCRCEAYLDKRGRPFPHRKYSGRCYAAEDEAEAARNEEQAEAWWLRKFGHYKRGSTAGPMGVK